MSDETPDYDKPLAIIGPEHPYVKHFDYAVTEWSEGRWRVKWRDFHAQKLDMIFDTEAEARAFGRTLVFGPHYYYDWDGSGLEGLAEQSAYWSELYGEKIRYLGHRIEGER